jgi:hypothetical protein
MHEPYGLGNRLRLLLGSGEFANMNLPCDVVSDILSIIIAQFVL